MSYTGDDLCDECGAYVSDCTCEFHGDPSALLATAEYTGWPPPVGRTVARSWPPDYEDGYCTACGCEPEHCHCDNDWSPRAEWTVNIKAFCQWCHDETARIEHPPGTDEYRSFCTQRCQLLAEKRDYEEEMRNDVECQHELRRGTKSSGAGV